MQQIDFSQGSIRRRILAVATPMLIAQLLNLLYNIVDRIYIGKIPGEGTLALASIGLCFPFVTLITAFANLFGLGGAPLCAMARGKGNREGAQRRLYAAAERCRADRARHRVSSPAALPVRRQ